MQENDTAVFEDEMEYSVPSNAAETVKRLWNVMGKQRIRLIIVAVSVLFYTVLSVAAPLYSAGIVDLLWGKIRQAWGEGAAFRVSWESGGRVIGERDGDLAVGGGADSGGGVSTIAGEDLSAEKGRPGNPVLP